MNFKTIAAVAAATAISASSAFAANWTSSIEGGIKQASITYGADHEILVMCDEGVNAPITSINFIVNGVAPLPDSSVRLRFDKDEPIFAQVDAEGGIGSLTAQGAQTFSNVLKKMKSKGKVAVRLFDGSEHVFALRGSTKSIGTCKADYERYSIASN